MSNQKDQTIISTPTPTKSISLDTLLEAKTLALSGASTKEIAQQLNIDNRYLSQRLKKLDTFLTTPSNSVIVQEDKQMVKNALQAKLEAIKDNMTSDAIEIIQQSDTLVKERLTTKDPDSSTKDIAAISKQYSDRLSNLTGLEELSSTDEKEKTTNVFVQNIFNRFSNNKGKE